MPRGFGVAVNPAVGVCGYGCGAGLGGVEGDLACTDDEDGRRTDDNLEGIVVRHRGRRAHRSSSCRRASWRRRHRVLCAFVRLPIVDERLGEVVAEGHDVTGNVDQAEVGFNGTDFVQCPGVV